jgi:SagB-type dehydrogenase family enzyme
MGLDEFVHRLQFDTDKVKPMEWEPDWDDAPTPYKLYRRLPVVPLSPEVPLTLEEREKPAEPNLREIGHFLWYVFGLTQLSQSVLAPDSTAEAAVPVQMCRRFAPSGGALYPSELYIYLKLGDLPAGVYHYDVAHHRLVLLREGRADAYLGRALGDRSDVSACFGVAFVSTIFWKNFFKYYNLSYRLQGLDAGVLIGQLLEVAKRFGFAAAVHFQFLDRAVNHLLGLSEREESVYAVIPLSAAPAADWFGSGKIGSGVVSAAELCRELPQVRHEHYVRSRRIAEYPMLIQMNEASMQESSESFRPIGARSGVDCEAPTALLPRVNRLSYDLASACRSRFSPESEFLLRQVSPLRLAELLQEATASFAYRNDLDGETEMPEPRVSLLCCLYGAEEIPDGAYRYDGAVHALRLLRSGDHRARLQRGMSLDNVNLFQVPLCLHVAGDKDHLRSRLGYRGYRIQQMEAGMLAQRLLLAASAIGMGGRPLLGFDANVCDEIYGLASLGQTCLLQIPIGPYRYRSRLEGSLHM